MIVVATGMKPDADLTKAVQFVHVLNTRDTLYAQVALKRKAFPVVVIMLPTEDLGKRLVEDWALDLAAGLEKAGLILELRV